MSIITCSECHEKFSTLVVTCPHRGAPMKKKSVLADTSKKETAPSSKML